MRRKAPPVLVLFLFSTALLRGQAAGPGGPPASRGLAKHDRTRLAELRVAAKPDAPILLAAMPGKVSAVAQAVQDAGGFVDLPRGIRWTPCGGRSCSNDESLADSRRSRRSTRHRHSTSAAPRFRTQIEARSPTPDAEGRPYLYRPLDATETATSRPRHRHSGLPARASLFDGRGARSGDRVPSRRAPPGVKEVGTRTTTVLRSPPPLSGNFDNLRWTSRWRDRIEIRGRRFSKGVIYTAPRDGRTGSA